MRSWITREPIDPAALLEEVGAPEDGAVLLFLGIVRNHNDGRSVGGMRYDAYVSMAESVLARIVEEAGERWGTDRLTAVHRVGELSVGEPSVAIVVSTPHRAEAYEASRYVIEELKRRLPVWKEERYVDGEARWLDGYVPPVPADAAAGAAGNEPVGKQVNEPITGAAPDTRGSGNRDAPDTAPAGGTSESTRAL